MQTAAKLYALGYRGVSNRFRIVARVDRDIRAFVEQDRDSMRRKHGHANWSQYDFLLRGSREQADDWFRRCLSKDKQTVSAAVYREIKRLEERHGRAQT